MRVVVSLGGSAGEGRWVIGTEKRERLGAIVGERDGCGWSESLKL